MFVKTLTLRFTSFRIKPGMTLPGTFYEFIKNESVVKFFILLLAFKNFNCIFHVSNIRIR